MQKQIAAAQDSLQAAESAIQEKEDLLKAEKAEQDKFTKTSDNLLKEQHSMQNEIYKLEMKKNLVEGYAK